MGTFAYHADNPKMSAITGNTVIQMPFDDAFRISCERQIEMELDGIGSHVMEKALAFNPEDRYQTLSEFFEALT